MKRARVVNVEAGTALEAALPGRYRSLVTPQMRRLAAVTAIFFDDAVATLRQARAVHDLGAKSTVLAFATDMTAEAREFLEDQGIAVHTLRGFGWTEERYRSISS